MDYRIVKREINDGEIYFIGQQVNKNFENDVRLLPSEKWIDIPLTKSNTKEDCINAVENYSARLVKSETVVHSVVELCFDVKQYEADKAELTKALVTAYNLMNNFKPKFPKEGE
jgi:hypothetical protein